MTDTDAKIAAMVPDLPCRKCGGQTSMRWCWPAAWTSFGGCRERYEHMHRNCPRCGHEWLTRDVPPDPVHTAERYEAEAEWIERAGFGPSGFGPSDQMIDWYRRRAEAARAKVAALAAASGTEGRDHD